MPRRKAKQLSEREVPAIIDKYDNNRLKISMSYTDGGVDPQWPRFNRAIMNQCESGEAALSRYAIWANTVRDNIIKAMREIENGNEDGAKRLLIRAANSLSAFADVQAYFDPFGLGEKPSLE